MDLNEKVQQLTTHGYDFKFGKYLSNGFNYFKAKASLFIGFFIISILIIIVASLIPMVGSIAAQILNVVFLVGYFIVANNIKNGRSVSFDDFFKGFSSIGQISLIQLIIFGFTLLLMTPLLVYGFTILFSVIMEAIKGNSFSEPQSISDLIALLNVDGIIPLAIITFIFLIFMQTVYSFAAVNAHFYKAPAWQCMEASRKVIQTKFFHFFGLIIVIGLINILGVLCLFVGLLVTVPLSYTILYAAFDDIMQPDEENKIVVDTTF